MLCHAAASTDTALLLCPMYGVCAPVKHLPAAPILFNAVSVLLLCLDTSPLQTALQATGSGFVQQPAEQPAPADGPDGSHTAGADAGRQLHPGHTPACAGEGHCSSAGVAEGPNSSIVYAVRRQLHAAGISQASLIGLDFGGVGVRHLCVSCHVLDRWLYTHFGSHHEPF